MEKFLTRWKERGRRKSTLFLLLLFIGVTLAGHFSRAGDECPTRGKWTIFDSAKYYLGDMDVPKVECLPPDENTAMAEAVITRNNPRKSANPSRVIGYMTRRMMGLEHCAMPVEDQAGFTEFDDPFYVPYVKILLGVWEGWDIFMSVVPSDPAPGEGEIDFHIGSDACPPDGSLGGPPGDLFILGDTNNPYYAGKKSPQDIDDDLVIIQNFDPGHSIIRLHGSPEDYVLSAACKPAPGTAIFLKKNIDMIGFVIGVMPDRLDLRGPRFEYAREPRMTPAIPGVDQVGGVGAQLFGWLTSDDDGNVHMFFGSDNKIPGGAAGEDVADDSKGGKGYFYMAKYGPTGEREWARRHMMPLPWSLIVVGDHLYINGIGRMDFGDGLPKCDMAGFAAKFHKSTGELAKGRNITPDPSVYEGLMWGIAADNGGNLYSVGSTSANDARTLPGISPVIVKVRQSDLSEVWHRVVHDPKSRPLKTGNFFDEPLGRVVFVPDNSGVPGKGFIYTGGFIDRGDFFGGCPGYLDIWYAKYDDQGIMLWGRSFGYPTEHDYPWDSAADSQGNFYMAGMTNGPMDGERYSGLTDGFIRKMDPNGDLIWTRLIGGAKADIIYAMEIVDDFIYVSGYTWSDLAGKNAGWSDVFVAKLDADGNILALKQFGTETIDSSFSLTVTNGRVYVSGQTEGSMVKPWTGSVDLFLTVLDAKSLEFIR